MRFLSKYWNCRLVKTGSLYILQFALFTNQSSGTRKKSVLTPLQWLSNEANHVCTLVFTLYVYCYSLLVCMLYFTCLNSNHWRRKTTQLLSCTNENELQARKVLHYTDKRLIHLTILLWWIYFKCFWIQRIMQNNHLVLVFRKTVIWQ